MSLFIVMPAYNEEGCIEPVVGSWLQLLDAIPGTLLVVNDGSRDHTGAILDRLAAQDKRLKVVHQKNGGHGAAVLNAYRTALGLDVTWVFQTDSDDQFRPQDFSLLWNKREESPFILGYRKLRSDAFHRKVISKIVVALTFLLFGVQLKDSNIPFRLMRADFLKALLGMLPEHVLAPNIFLSVLAKKCGAQLFEIPIQHEERQSGNVSILRWRLVKLCLRSAVELVTFRVAMLERRRDLKSLRATNG